MDCPVTFRSRHSFSSVVVVHGQETCKCITVVKGMGTGCGQTRTLLQIQIKPRVSGKKVTWKSKYENEDQDEGRRGWGERMSANKCSNTGIESSQVCVG